MRFNYQNYKEFCERAHVNGVRLIIKLSQKEQKKAEKALQLVTIEEDL